MANPTTIVPSPQEPALGKKRKLKTKVTTSEPKKNKKELILPSIKSSSPIRKVGLLLDKPSSAMSKTSSPLKKPHSTLRKSVSPFKKIELPERQTESPVRQTESPVNQTKSSVTKPKLAVKKVGSPRRTGSSPTRTVPNTATSERYPILKNEELITKFLNVPMTNNQKGRLRQLLKDNLKGTSDLLLPDVIHNKIQTILKSSHTLNDTDLRKIRILYNMLKTATIIESQNKGKADPKSSTEADTKKKSDKAKNNKSKVTDVKDSNSVAKTLEQQKVKGPKRYVVFVGNLPLGIGKQQIIEHFSDISQYIKDVRIPKPSENKNSSIAYLELKDEPSYELALSKHHSMLANKRINVLYTTQSNSKVSKTEAKGKAAKLVALQKSGKLLGSVPLNRKRSQRRKKKKMAEAKAAAAQT